MGCVTLNLCCVTYSVHDEFSALEKPVISTVHTSPVDVVLSWMVLPDESAYVFRSRGSVGGTVCWRSCPVSIRSLPVPTSLSGRLLGLPLNHHPRSQSRHHYPGRRFGPALGALRMPGTLTMALTIDVLRSNLRLRTVGKGRGSIACPCS